MESKRQDRNFGSRAEIVPKNLVQDLSEEWEQEDVLFKIEKATFELNFRDKAQKDRAIELAQLYIDAWNFEHGNRISANFNHYWEPSVNGGKNVYMNFEDKITVNDRLQTTHTLSVTAKARIVESFDSASVKDNKTLVNKASRDVTLRKALRYYSEEVINDDKPLYGIYKALESLTKQLERQGRRDGRKALGELAGKGKSYVNDVMQTTQSERHSETPASKVLSDEECRTRTKKLIKAYVDSLSV